MRKFENLIRKVFSDLTVISLTRKETSKPTVWQCLCSCGNITNVQSARLKSGKTKSCGHRRIKHGKYGTLAHVSWNNMKNRCLNPMSDSYYKYGGVGITVCERWLTFENFLEDMGERPEGTTLNRINSANIYSKETCEWATLSIQSYDQKLDPRNTTGLAGVRWRKDRKVWEARISIDKEQIILYYGNDFWEAACKRKSAENKFYGKG